MGNNVKSGKEILNDFFGNLEKIENVDKGVAETLKKLYQDGKFTDTSITNALQELREKGGADGQN
ncbi:hypothetical protein KKE19_04690 [Patescibacteria group bacterium]|nr:hypothetical protein [Patescibacteria group bacterium]MCG2821290.1 hypothetical protein [Candidatus Atribacteria bacterium]